MRGLQLRMLAGLTVLGALSFSAAPAAAATPLSYYGGEVENNPHVYLTFWGKNWNENSGARTEIREMIARLSGSDYQKILSQYGDQSGPISSEVSLSSWTDESINAPSAVNRAHVENEIEYALAQRGWPGGGIDNLYIVLPAPGSSYAFSECGSHHFSSALNAPFASVSWPGDIVGATCADADPATPDRNWVGASINVSHEYSEAVTDPVPITDAGHYTGWVDGSGWEIADKCESLKGGQLANGSWVEPLWSNAQSACVFSGPPPATWHYDNLGGGIIGDPTVASTGTGHLNVFVRGLDGNLWQKWWAGSGWSEWQNLSALGGGPISSGPGAVAWDSTRVDVVARMTNGSVGHWYWDGSSWHFDNLGGNILGDPEIASTGSDHLNVFVRGEDGNLWQRWWAGAGWSGWQNLSAFGGGPISSGPGAVAWDSSRVDVVARMTNGSVGHWYYEGSWHFDNLGGNILGDPDVSSTGPYHLNVFVRGEDGNLWQKWWAGTGWSQWQNLSAAVGGPISSGPGAVSWNYLRADVVARMPDGSLGHWWYE